jgi:hypothetical protein
MNKKLLKIGLVVCLVALSGCGSSPPDDGGSPNIDQTQPSDSQNTDRTQSGDSTDDTSTSQAAYSDSVDLESVLITRPQLPAGFTLQSLKEDSGLLSEHDGVTKTYQNQFVRTRESETDGAILVQSSVGRYGSVDAAEQASKAVVEEFGHSPSEVAQDHDSMGLYYRFEYDSESGYTSTVLVRPDSNVVHMIIVGDGESSQAVELMELQSLQLARLDG